jgi:cell wall-associated NlpC family hydrolase
LRFKKIILLTSLISLSSVSLTYAEPTPAGVQQKDQLQINISLNNQIIQSNRDKIQTLDDSIAQLDDYLDSVQQKSNNLSILLKEQNDKVDTNLNNIKNMKEQMVVSEYDNVLSNLSDIVNKKKVPLIDGTDNSQPSTLKLKEMESSLETTTKIRDDLALRQNIQKETTANINLIYTDIINKMISRVQLENYLLQENAMSNEQLATIKKKLEFDIKTKSMNSFLISRGDSSTEMGSKIVSEGKKYLGIPYVWGGTSPKGMDCSGLVVLVMNSLGIHPPRVSVDQSKFGKEVPLSDIQPGDLLFFDTLMKGYVTHVAIYIGNGQILQAPTTGDVVKISNLSRYYQSSFITARRYY